MMGRVVRIDRHQEPAALSESRDKLKSRPALEEILQYLQPQKIIQTGLECANGIQTAVRIARFLIKQVSRKRIFYAIARNPETYLAAISALREKGLLGEVQVLLGLSISRDELVQPSINTGDIHSTRPRADSTGAPQQAEPGPASYAKMSEYLPDRLLHGCLKDMGFLPDLVVLGSDCGIAKREVEELLAALKDQTHLLLTSEQESLPEFPFHLPVPDSCVSRVADCRDPGGALFVAREWSAKAQTGVQSPSQHAEPYSRRKRIAIALIEHMGDIVACEPVVRQIKESQPEAHLTWVTRDAYRELIENNPFVDDILTVECLTEWSLLAKSGIFDEIVDLHINNRECPRCGVLARRWSTREEVSLENYYNYGPLLSVFSSGAGLPALTGGPRVYIPESVRAKVDDLQLPGDFVVFHCSSNEYSRDWAPEKWQELTRKLHQIRAGKIVEVGAKSCLGPSTPAGVLNLCGRLSILESADVIRRAKLFVGVDSGPAHLANAVGTRGIILLGEYRAFKRYLPFTGDYADGSNATLLYANDGPARSIETERVLAAVLEDLEKVAVSNTRSDSTTTPADGRKRDGGDRLAPVRLIAFHLPQFHPIPENDRWWGKGFTEWRNVSRGKPLFEGHYQPHLPGDLGFYDLRVPEVLEQQAAMARTAGIGGFCFWHYWFDGKLLLEKPILRMLESGKPDFPFCLAWANENWTRRWDGQESDILIKQSYGGEGDARRHFDWLADTFSDPRYMQVEGRPVFLIYRPFDIPDVSNMIALWARIAERRGMRPPFMIAVRTNFDAHSEFRSDELGFDAELIFQPNSPGTYHKIRDLIAGRHKLFPQFYSEEARVLTEKGATVVDYEEAWPLFADPSLSSPACYSSVVPSWDNTSRRANHGAFILHRASPTSYEQWLRYEITCCMGKPERDRLVFINAWNEWAEGNHLEPDLQFGTAYVDATRRALEKARLADEDPSEFLRHTRELSRVQPLLRRVIRSMHLRESCGSSTIAVPRHESLLERTTEIVSAAAKSKRFEEGMMCVLTATVRELNTHHGAAPMLLQLYNHASGLAEKEQRKEARLLFTLLAETTAQSNPELCGKSHYKLALLSRRRIDVVRHLEHCVQLYPEHRAARKTLDELAAPARKGVTNV